MEGWGTRRRQVRAILIALAFCALPGFAFAAELADYERSGAAFQEGLAFSERGLYRAAIRAFERAVSLDAAFVEAMVNLARAHLERGEVELAAQWLDRAVRKEPGYPDLHTVRGLVALSQDRSQEALVAFGRARSLAPEDVEVLANLGATLLHLGHRGGGAHRARAGLRARTHSSGGRAKPRDYMGAARGSRASRIPVSEVSRSGRGERPRP